MGSSGSKIEDFNEEYYGLQKKIKDVEWEYILFEIISLENLPKEFLGLDNPDPTIKLEAIGGSVDLPITPPPNECQFVTRWDAKTPVWNELGFVAYGKGQVEKVKITIMDDNKMLKDTLLLEKEVPIPKDIGKWSNEMVLKEKDLTIKFKMRRDTKPVQNEDAYKNMDLKEIKFDVNGKVGYETGIQASLKYHQAESNTKAVMYFPGLVDTFRHPHLLDLFSSEGFDFYSLDPHGCGRTAKYLKDPRYAHDVPEQNFDAYIKDIDKTIEFMKKSKDYDSVLVYAHSTGAPIFLNYYLNKRENDNSIAKYFDAVIMNGPFLDFGGDATDGIGSSCNEFILESILTRLPFFASKNLNLISADKNEFVMFRARRWILYNTPVDSSIICSTNITLNYMKAVTKVHRHLNKSIKKDKGHVVGFDELPCLFMSSKGDTILTHKESLGRATGLFENPEIHQLQHNFHDVCLSDTKELNEIPLEIIRDWLKKTFPANDDKKKEVEYDC